MSRRAGRHIVVRIMIEHAVFWKDSRAPGTLFGGGVVVERDHLRLRGSDGHANVVETVPGPELAAVEPDAGAGSIAGFPSLRLDLRNGRSLVLAAALGSTTLVELINNLLSLTTLLPGG
jgi:hypothetical protein